MILVIIQFFVLDDHIECSWGDVRQGKVGPKVIWDQLEGALDRMLGQKDISMIEWKPYIFLMYEAIDEICRPFNDV